MVRVSHPSEQIEHAFALGRIDRGRHRLGRLAVVARRVGRTAHRRRPAAREAAADVRRHVGRARAARVFGVDEVAVDERDVLRRRCLDRRTPVDGRLHVVEPDRQRQRRTGRAPHRARRVVAEPRNGDDARRVAGEPHVLRAVRRARLAGRVVAAQRERARGAGLHDVAQHAVHHERVARRHDALTRRRRRLVYRAAVTLLHREDQARLHPRAAVREHAVRARQFERRHGARAERERQRRRIALRVEAEVHRVLLHVARVGSLHQADRHQVLRAHGSAPHRNEALVVVGEIARAPWTRAGFLMRERALRIVDEHAREVALFSAAE